MLSTPAVSTPAGTNTQRPCGNIKPRFPVHAGLTLGVGDRVTAPERDHLLSRIVCTHGQVASTGQIAQSISDQGVQMEKLGEVNLTKVTEDANSKSRACRVCTLTSRSSLQQQEKSTSPQRSGPPGPLLSTFTCDCPLQQGWGPCCR